MLSAQLFCELGLAVPGDPPVEPHDAVRHGHVDPVRFRVRDLRRIAATCSGYGNVLGDLGRW
jgi:hypothetical protein